MMKTETESFIPEELKDIYKQPEKTTSLSESISYLKIDYDSGAFSARLPSEEGYKWQILSETLEVQLVYIGYYYNAFDGKSMLAETSIHKYGGDVIVYNYKMNTVESFSTSEFKVYKESIKAEGIKLKFQRACFFKILDGEHKDKIFNFAIKLSQSHGMIDRKFRFKNPIKDGLAAFLADKKELYAMTKIKLSTASYKAGVMTVRYPIFSEIGTIEINATEVLTLLDIIKTEEDKKEARISLSL